LRRTALSLGKNMTNQALNSFRQEGGWNSSYSSHYESAWLFLFDYEEILKTLKLEELRIAEENHSFPAEYLSSYIFHETRSLHRNAYRYATSAHLFVCMAVEGFINYYGTKRLGEEVYKRLLERVGITEKLALIYLICFQINLEVKSDPIKSIRTIFDQRNALVHPKTKEIDFNNLDKFVYKHPETLDLKRAFESMELFVDDICLRDSEVDRNFHFAKPNKSIQPTADASAN
jgi:hypothetical protein